MDEGNENLAKLLSSVFNIYIWKHYVVQSSYLKELEAIVIFPPVYDPLFFLVFS
jgi:hypothetical protein